MHVPLLRAEGLTMETISLQRLEDAAPRHIITACEDTDTCPGCGAGYRVGLSECEYCRRPVKVSMAEVVAPVGAFMTGQAS